MQLTNKIVIGSDLIKPAGESFDVLNPATGSLLQSCTSASSEQVDLAIATAKHAFTAWSEQTHESRQQALLKVADTIAENIDELARILVLEQGKPLQAAKNEINGAVAFTRFFSNLTLPHETVVNNDEKRIEVYRKPLGVVASITPWNYPLMILIWHTMPALCAGNTVVCKPSEYTPFSSIKLLEYIAKVLPVGVMNLVTGRGEVGAQLTSHVDVKKVVFTGSIGTGRAIMKSASDTLKKLTLELGGNDAGVILPGTDFSKYIERIFVAAFKNQGQTCAALKRLYVHESQIDEVAKLLAERASKEVVGDGLGDSTTFGPVQNRQQFELIKSLLDDVRKTGGEILSGGEPAENGGYFLAPTIVNRAPKDSRIVRTEQFGPILPIVAFTDLKELMSEVNSGEEGLGGSVWGDDTEQAIALAKQFETGSTWINNHGELNPMAPFGGCKMSGIGSEFGQNALLDYTISHSMHISL